MSHQLANYREDFCILISPILFLFLVAVIFNIFDREFIISHLQCGLLWKEWQQVSDPCLTGKFFELKEQIECHLCNVINNLLNIDNKLNFFNLTNFYFVGSKRDSKKARFGRSKEKQSDAIMQSPLKQATAIYDKLKYAPFRKKKM